MKPINSQERSKQVGQFIFIFILGCILPVGLIFFSYYAVPEKLTDDQQQKLMSYSSFEHNQKAIVKQLVEIDSNINIMVKGTTNIDATLLQTKIAGQIEAINSLDNTVLVQSIYKSFSNYYTNSKNLIQANTNVTSLKTNLDKAQSDLKDCLNRASMSNNSQPSK